MLSSSVAMLFHVAACEATTSGLPVSSSSIWRSGSKYSIAQLRPLASSAVIGSITVAVTSRPSPAPASRSSTQPSLLIASVRPWMLSPRPDPVHGWRVDSTGATRELSVMAVGLSGLARSGHPVGDGAHRVDDPGVQFRVVVGGVPQRVGGQAQVLLDVGDQLVLARVDRTSTRLDY